MLSLSSNRASAKPNRTPGQPTSKIVLSRIRGFNASLTFKRSAATPSPFVSPANVDIPSPRKRPAPRTSIAQVAIPRKTTFQWVKGELLGRGSYAQVFLALNATTGEIMAVKQVELPQTASDRSNSRQLDIMQALKLEQNTLKDLDHSNIVQYLGYEESPRYLSIFLEYVPGGTISSCLKNHGRFDEGVTKSFTSQILLGLEYLHSRGILHRDLKADNILVETTGVCKISDFGISKKTYNARAFTAMKGTIFWMAPEILESKGKGYDVKVDIWSVGCIVLEMWTGDRPWSGEDFFPVLFKLFQQKSPPPTPVNVDLSEDAIDFRRQCFQMDPEDRPSAAELRHHPYLRLPPGWKFKLSDIEGSPHFHRSSSLASRKSRKSWKSIRHVKSFLADPNEVVPSVLATSRPLRAAPSHIETRAPPPILDLATQSASRSPRIPNQGPPIVYITPPNSPRRDVIHDHEGKVSVHASDPSFETTRRQFRIINPDPEPDQIPTFVYNPPPLPNTSSRFPYSSQLAPPSLHHLPTGSHYSNPLPSTPLSPNRSNQLESHGMSHHLEIYPAIKNYLRDSISPSRLNAEGGFEYDTDSDTGGASFWNKPPLDLLSPDSTKSRFTQSDMNHRFSVSSRRKGNIPMNRISIQRSDKDMIWATRPSPETVYDHLQTYFPDHDVDRIVIDTDNFDSREDKTTRQRRVKKSIRMVAEEQVNRNVQLGSRRRTKLWDSNVEELRMQ